MENYVLKNNFLKAVFTIKGAELISLTSGTIEYIWQGNPEFWKRHTPILFPIVGGLKNNQYTYKDNTYTMGQHGFARDRDFTVIEHTENCIVFEITADETSKEIYPFDFILQLKYTLNHKQLSTSYIVKNPSDKDLYFSIGGHPAFNCPFTKNHTREEYSIVFDHDKSPKSQLLSNGLRIDEEDVVFKKEGVVEIKKNIFDKDALIFNPNPFAKASFIHTNTNKTYMSLIFKNFPYLGVWSKNQNSPFVCIEPWYGIADHQNHNGDLTLKEGIIKLTAKENFSCEYSIVTEG